MSREEVIKCLKAMKRFARDIFAEERLDWQYSLDMAIKALEEPKTVSIKQLEEMYEKYEKLLWKEHEDVRGDDMIEVGYAEQFLQDLLMEFGCWDREESE